MELEFLKMQGCGDDVLIIDGFKQSLPEEDRLSRLAARILDRHTGVGANALAILRKGNRQNISVAAFSPAGSQPPGCNALRCVARYASDSGTAVTAEFPMETVSGDLRARIVDSVNVRVDMGVPSGRGLVAELKERPLDSFTCTLDAQGKPVTYTPVSLGKWFGVVFVRAFDFPFLREVGRIVRHPQFPAATGLVFAQVYNREELRVRAWDAATTGALNRGGPALRRLGAEVRTSCTAAASATVAAVVSGFTDRDVFVHQAGGDLYVQWAERDNRVYLTGPTAYCFTGTFYFEEDEN